MSADPLTPTTPSPSLEDVEQFRSAWLVWSNEHDAWWRPNSAGYTNDIRAAGIYTHDRAHEIVEQALPRAHSTLRPGSHPEVAVTLASALAACTQKGTVAELLIATQRPTAAAVDDRDSVRLDWLEGEMQREGERIIAQDGRGIVDVGHVWAQSLFRRNVPITRAAIDAAMSAALNHQPEPRAHG